MKHLLKADFYRIKKSVLAKIALIIAVVYPLITSLLYLGIDAFMEFISKESGESFFPLFDAKTILQTTFSLSNDMGLVIPLFCAIFICNGISSGTLRNKIISGNSHKNVYLSHLLTSVIFNVIIITIYALFSLLFSTLFFGFSDEFSIDYLIDILEWLVSGVLTYVFISTVTTLIALVSRGIGGTIIFTLVSCTGIGFLSTLCQFIGSKEALKDIIYIMPTYISTVGIGNMSLTNFVTGCGFTLLFSLLNVFIGIKWFLSKDIK